MEILKAMFSLNLITVIIWVLGLITGLMLFFTRKSIQKLEKTVHPQNDIRNGIQANIALTDNLCKKLSDFSSRASSGYSFFTNFTAVFPLLGILGTVVSLMEMSTENLQDSFSSALATTCWGLIFAIIFKCFDASISARLDRALDEADYLIHEHDKEKRAAQ